AALPLARDTRDAQMGPMDLDYYTRLAREAGLPDRHPRTAEAQIGGPTGRPMPRNCKPRWFPNCPSIRIIGEGVAPAAGAAGHQTDHGGGRAEQDQEEQANAQRGEFGEESDGRRPHQKAEIAEAADGGDTSAFADLGDAAAGGKDERDDAGEPGAGGGE